MHAQHMSSAPTWLVWVLAAVFSVSGLLYLLRLASPRLSRKIHGYYDPDGEIAHALCVFAMAFAMSPLADGLLRLWQWTLVIGGTWFLVRGLTWGRRLSWNVWWWDWAHVGMLYGMAAMFLDVTNSPTTIVQGLFWVWFSGYYVYDTIRDARMDTGPAGPEALKLRKYSYLCSDAAHLSMGVVMSVMIFLPGYLHPRHSTDGIEAAGQTASNDTVLATDDSFDDLVAKSPVPVFVLFQGTCENCVAERLIFEEVARKRSGRATFIWVKLFESPRVAKALSVNECPCLVVLKQGQLQPQRLTEFTNSAGMTDFIDKQLMR